MPSDAPIELVWCSALSPSTTSTWRTLMESSTCEASAATRITSTSLAWFACCLAARPWKTPPSPTASRSSYVPSSTMTPFWTTAILSQYLIVVSRCATVTDVKWLFLMMSSSDACTMRSLALSSADVASSSSSTAGLRTMARAIATRCFWPPERRLPLRPTCVAYPSARLLVMKPCALAKRAAPSTSASLAPALPYRMLSATEPWKRTGSCPTSPSCARSQRTFRSRRSTPSSRIAPPCGS
mmetsp:Transcript_24176/g.71989  ORF Transcript_24176/g.71989 Transcript_24176/m.71989 type:complete len:241 (+) Transcript_24176:1618-2340(+)